MHLNVQAALVVTVCGCVIGRSAGRAHRAVVMPEGALLLSDAESGQAIPQALVLVTRYYEKGRVHAYRPEATRCYLRDAFAFHSGEQFTLHDMWGKTRPTLNPLSPLTESDESANFLVVARGYRPKCFMSYDKMDDFKRTRGWRLTPQGQAQVARDFEELRALLAGTVIPAGTFQKWDVEDVSEPYTQNKELMAISLPVIFHTDLPVDVELTPEARKIVSDFLGQH